LANGALHQQGLMHERISARTNGAFPARMAATLHELRQACLPKPGIAPALMLQQRIKRALR
jgi:hypothetical protein